MPAPAPAQNHGADEGRDRAAAAAGSAAAASADPQAQRGSKHRYRTVIPAPSGNYAFIKTIGQGSMGKVKLAKREGTGELVSLGCCALHPALRHSSG